MKISMHAMSHAVFKKALTQLLHVMDKGIANAKARNLDFQEKRLAMFAGVSSQAFPITNDLTGYNSWDEDELLKRHQKLVGLACQMLGLPPAFALHEAAE